MRTVVPIAALLVLSLNLGPLRASGSDSIPPDQQSIDALEARAVQAQPRDQCFLYAELVQQMTELSIRQYAAGDITKATGMLQRIQSITQKIHLSLADNDKRLKNAQILLSRTAFRLTEMLHASSVDDQPLVQATLRQVNQAQNDAMMQVFKK
jgi:hypothetical protein